MKKASILATLILPVLLLAGCSSSTSGTKTTTNTGKNSSKGSSSKVVNVTVWDDYSRSTANGKAYMKMVDTFNQTHPDIHIDSQFVSVGDEMLPKITTALAGDQEPDLVAGGYPTWGPGLLSSGKVLDLTNFLNNSKTMTADGFYPGMLDVSSYKGKVLSIPNDGGDYGLFYNKKVFEQAGISSPPTTWKDVLKDSQIIKQKTGKYGFYVPIGNTEWTVWTFEGMLWANGGTFIDTSGDKAKVEFNSQQGVDALQTWVDMIHKDKVSPDTAYPVSMPVATYLQKGAVSMALDGPWDVNTLQKANYPLGVTMFPKGSDSYATNLGTDVFYIFKKDQAKEQAAWTFIEWFMQPKNLAQWDIETGLLPTENAVLDVPAYKDFLNKNPNFKPLVDNLKYAHGRPTLKSYNDISTELGNDLEEALYGKISAKQALDQAAQKAESILNKNNE